MLRKEKVKEIKRLLDAGGLSQRAIARQLGVARGTVNAIALGRRGLHGREIGGDCVDELPRGRCEECGFVGYVPCIVCQARSYQSRHPIPAGAPTRKAA